MKSNNQDTEFTVYVSILYNIVSNVNNNFLVPLSLPLLPPSKKKSLIRKSYKAIPEQRHMKLNNQDAEFTVYISIFYNIVNNLNNNSAFVPSQLPLLPEQRITNQKRPYFFRISFPISSNKKHRHLGLLLNKKKP